MNSLEHINNTRAAKKGESRRPEADKWRGIKQIKGENSVARDILWQEGKRMLEMDNSKYRQIIIANIHGHGLTLPLWERVRLVPG